jgi:hypothetical protein
MKYPLIDPQIGIVSLKHVLVRRYELCSEIYALAEYGHFLVGAVMVVDFG